MGRGKRERQREGGAQADTHIADHGLHQVVGFLDTLLGVLLKQIFQPLRWRREEKRQRGREGENRVRGQCSDVRPSDTWRGRARTADWASWSMRRSSDSERKDCTHGQQANEGTRGHQTARRRGSQRQVGGACRSNTPGMYVYVCVRERVYAQICICGCVSMWPSAHAPWTPSGR